MIQRFENIRVFTLVSELEMSFVVNHVKVYELLQIWSLDADLWQKCAKMWQQKLQQGIVAISFVQNRLFGLDITKAAIMEKIDK